MADQGNITNLSELGEFALIDKLVKNVKIYNDSTQKAVGDDAAVTVARRLHIDLAVACLNRL